jgi:hypothetical protein
MRTKYVVCVDDEPVDLPYDSLERAKALGLEYIQSGKASVRVDVYYASPTIPMSAWIFDPALQGWTDLALPSDIDLDR